jgi:hypothetical protein
MNEHRLLVCDVIKASRIWQALIELGKPNGNSFLDKRRSTLQDIITIMIFSKRFGSGPINSLSNGFVHQNLFY